MAAIQTVSQDLPLRNFDNGVFPENHLVGAEPHALKPSQGVLTLYGYGTHVRVERGHLVLDDGIGSDRYTGRFSKIGHGLERLVLIGTDGLVSLAALRWLADQSAAFVMLERDGSVTTVTGPVRPSDSRLRRAQALAHHTGSALRISRELIDRKLAGQQRVVNDLLKDHTASEHILRTRSELGETESGADVRAVEARGAQIYWRAWRSLPITFPTKEMPRVPEHWRTFGSRASVLSGSPRLAVNPVNAILNYLYALLEAECRLAIATLGLDPGLGLLHLDAPNRDSLACDLMEPIRPDVDAYVLAWLQRQPLKRNWFFEQRNGNCRITAELAKQLAETAQVWGRLVAPVAEWVANEIASTSKSRKTLPTRLTRNNKRSVPDRKSTAGLTMAPRPEKVCADCGRRIHKQYGRCRSCHSTSSVDYLKRIAVEGRVASHTSIAEERRSTTQRVNTTANANWCAADQPAWLTRQYYVKRILPALAETNSRAIARALAVSRGYAVEIQRGRLPHPRHWLALAESVGLSG